MDSSFEVQENKLLRYFEAKYSEAMDVIGQLEKEIDELKKKRTIDIFENQSNYPQKFVILFEFNLDILSEKAFIGKMEKTSLLVDMTFIMMKNFSC